MLQNTVVLTVADYEEGVNAVGQITKGMVKALVIVGKPLTAATPLSCLNPGYTPVAAVLMLIELVVGKVRYVLRGGLSPFSSYRLIDPVVIP